MSKGATELLPRGGGVFSFFQGSEVVAIEMEPLEVPELGEGATELLPRGIPEFRKAIEVVYRRGADHVDHLPRLTHRADARRARGGGGEVEMGQLGHRVAHAFVADTGRGVSTVDVRDPDPEDGCRGGGGHKNCVKKL